MSYSNQGEGRHRWASIRAAGSKSAILVALVVGLLMAVSSTMSAMADTAIVIGGLGAKSLSDRLMAEALGGAFGGDDWERQSVSWPAQAGPILGLVSMGESVAVGTKNMLKAIKTTYQVNPEDPITVFGMSEGSAVVDEVMRALANDPTAPPPAS